MSLFYEYKKDYDDDIFFRVIYNLNNESIKKKKEMIAKHFVNF